MRPKISLIITVYNKAPFLRRCLDSVANQTNQDAQVIIVDDGSTDGSTAICSQYREKYDWDLWCTQNRGVSEARNLGLDKAEGDYITFLDADDLYVPDAVASMVAEVAKGHNICQFRQHRCRKYSELNKTAYGSPQGDYGLDLIPRYWVLVWNKLYKRSFLRDNHLRFKPGMQFGEDTLFNAQCILANGGLYHAPEVTTIHCLDDKKSLCRGQMEMAKAQLLDNELVKLYNAQVDPAKANWVKTAIDEHRNSKLFRRYGVGIDNGGKYDIVYFVKDAPVNDELVYSLRSVEKNLPYRRVCFCGGCPKNLRPDQQIKVTQDGTSKWNNVRAMIAEICRSDFITDDFWLFNDDFFVLKPMPEDMPPQYNGDLISYVDRIDRKQGHSDDFTRRLRCAAEILAARGKTTLNYEVHKPMLINRKKALEVMEQFPRTPAFRSIYGNCLNIGGENKHDMKVKVTKFNKLFFVENVWEFVSTDDNSFESGDVGEMIRMRFTERSRFEI